MMTLRRKLTFLVALAAVIPVAIMIGLTLTAQENLVLQAKGELNLLVRTNLAQIAGDIYALCDTVNNVVAKDLDMDLAAAQRAMAKCGAPNLGAESADWDAVDSLTRQARRVPLKKFMLGNAWLGQSRDPDEHVPVVDEIGREADCVCSVFQLMNEKGDMIRVATTVLDETGRRAIGSFIPAVEGDGSPNEAISAVLRGETFRGLATVITNRMFSVYAPIQDANGKIIGMLCVGKRPETIASIRRAISGIRIGKDGYVAVLGGKGRFRGCYLIAPKAEDEGRNLWDQTAKRPDGSERHFIRSMVTNSVAGGGRAIHFEHYPWPKPGVPGAEIPEKTGACIYFAPWDWVICATLYEEDYYAAAEKIESTMTSLAVTLSLAGLVILIVAVLAALAVGARVAEPLGMIGRVAGDIARGEIAAARKSLEAFDAESLGRGRLRRFLVSEREVTVLMKAFREMIAGLETLIGQVLRSGIQVTTSSTEIAAGARQMESAAAEQSASVREVTETTREIAGTTDGLVEAMDGVAQAMARTANTAESGRADLSRMEQAMRQLVAATGSISSKLAVISGKANKISSVVTAINKISDQTNLLSLNAAIEAESAGESGRGFAVVARETSRLAEQTATATQDIERMVREMQSSVSSGVMEMDKFADEVRKSVEEVAAIAAQLGSVIDQVKTLSPRFDQVKDGMNRQAEGAQQITGAMKQLSEVALQTRESLHEFGKVAGALNAAVQGLKGEVTRFRIG